MDDKQILDAVAYELRAARHNFPDMTSPHEAYAVILEELDEFWTEVKKKPARRDSQILFTELIQVAAMAVRSASDLALIDTGLSQTAQSQSRPIK